MKAERETKYKECAPGETVERARSILNALNIELEEHWEDTGVDGFYTLRTNIPGTGLGTNGKGATREYAQASAYAEFLERLQNNYLSLGDYDEATWKYKGFYCTPDEKLMSAAELAESDNALVDLLIKAVAREQRRNIDTPKSRADAVALWQFPAFPDCGDKFVAVRYYSVKNKRYEYLPQAICLKLYGSNGMCAGNTPHEALVQGLSEIFERYVNLKVIKERIKLPTIPDWYLARYKRLYRTIKGIEKDGRYKVLVKDGSLGMGYPVAILIIFDKKRQTYGIRFGAHPEFEIALERTLSEALQGKTLETFTGLSTLRFDNAGVQHANNIINIAKAGSGQYPIELLGGAADYEFVPFADVTGKSNSELMQDMLELITSKGFDVLIKDASYLGFPAYHVISPGFSELNEVNLQKIREVRYNQEMRKMLKSLHSASDSELREVVYYLKNKQNSINDNTFSTMIGVDFRSKYPGGNYEQCFLSGICLYKLGYYKEAAAFFELVANNLTDSKEKKYNRCIADYAAAMAENKPQKEITEILQLFYPEDIAQKVSRVMKNPREIIENFYPEFKCFSCNECNASGNCNYNIARRIRKAFKERQAEARLKDLQELGV